LFNLDELNIYSLYSYISYGLLFVVLLLVMQAFVSASRPFKVSTLISTKAIIVYSIFAASYMMSVIFVLGFKKECERSKVWANKLSVERDLGMEIKLRSIESAIQYDQAILSMFSYPGYGITSIQNRINEIYLQGASQKYEMQITVFKPSGGLIYSGGRMIGEDMFRSEILQYGSPLSRKEKFFFLNNYNGRVSYIGFFTYTLKDGSNIDLYVELESRKEVSGVPALLFDYKQANNLNIPGYYSYAKFINARLVLYRGQYNYSTVADTSGIRDGFSIIKRDGYVHFVNKFSDDNIIMVSRKEKSAIPYIVSISYVILFILLLFLLFFSLRRINTGFFIMRLPKNSFRRKITTLLVTSLVVSLLCMGIGCVWLSVQYYNEENRSHMEEKLLTAQSTIADYCKYADSYNSINTSGLYDAMSRLAGDIRTNINLYSPQGSLIRSTQPELFERFLLSSRMNSSAFYKIIRGRKRQLINKERISGLKYYSLYAPVFNLSGTLIAIVNIPYFSRTADLRGDISSIIAAIINFYILLLLASIFGGTMVSNSLSRPLAEISTKMRLMDISKKTEHINYKNNDELGVLVKAYNKMLDDVQAGTRAIAETERKQAWSEMARQIAHEIKNPLTPMRLSIQYLVRLKKNNVTGWQDKFEDISQSILEQIDILSETASEFSSFAKFYYEEKSVINLYDIVKEERLLFDNKADIKILFDYCSEQCPVFVRKGQIIRVVVNLLSNAVQALEPAGRGYIRISIKESGEYYVVSFEDNGPGVKEEDLDKLFKPNFTTKSSGTGLGLAISKNIIDQSGGSISYRKSQFGGADFSFRLKKYYDI
jgi:signal transduction histidine kinase